MKILVTGSNGFVGKNLISELRNQGFTDIIEYDIDTEVDKLQKYTSECDFIFHLAGVNRPHNQEEFMQGNFGFTSILLDLLKKNNNKSPILITSSTQAALNNPYGESKKAGEDLMFEYSKTTGIPVCVFRLTNVFGKWCRPNYNSAVATFCHNTANNLALQINDRNTRLKLIYIDDVISSFINILKNGTSETGTHLFIIPEYEITLGDIADLLK